MRSMILACLVTGTAMAGGLAAAQMPPGPGMGLHPLFDRLDANKDSVVTRSEVKSSVESHFDEADTNHDGVLTEAEREVARNQEMQAHFKSMDTDGNGQLSFAEFEAAHPRMGGRGPDGRPMPKPPGDVRKSDAVGRALAMFDRVDANKDGKITAQERDAAQERMRAKHHHGDGPPMEPPPPPPMP